MYVPNKARFNYTEPEMLVANHNKEVMYTYKGLFVCPSPMRFISRITLIFSKFGSLTDTYCGKLNNPIDCHWHCCILPSSISSTSYHT